MAEEAIANPFAEAPKSKKTLILLSIFLGVCANLMISTTNSTVLVVAANQIGGMDIYPLATSISGILGVCIMPIYGYFSSRYPHKRSFMLILSLLIGAATLIIRAFAPNMVTIIAASFFWGMLSAGIFVVGYTMIRSMYEAHQFAIYFGWIGLAMSAAKLLGPIISAFMMDNMEIGWRLFWVFAAALLVIAALMVSRGVKVTKEEVAHMARGGAKFDFVGAIGFILLLSGFTTAFSLTKYIPLGTGTSWLLLAVAAVGLVVVIVNTAKKKTQALIPTHVLKDKNTMCIAIMNFFSLASTMGVLFFVPSLIMRTMTEDPLVMLLGVALAGSLPTVMIGIGGGIISPFYGKWMAKVQKINGVVYLSVIARVVCFIMLIVSITGGWPVWTIYVIMFVAGLYNAQSMTAASTGAQIQIKKDIRALGNGVVQLGQNLGSVVATVVFTYVITTYGLGQGLIIGLVISCVFGVCMAICMIPLKKLEAEEV